MKGILIVIFIISVILIVAPFAADIEFNSAKKLAEAYLWERAEEKFDKAIKLDPFDTEHLAWEADFLRKISSTRLDETAFLNKAEKLYERALKLNPYEAEYYLGAGQVELALFLKDKEKYKSKFQKAIDDLRKALQNDPRGFNIAYEVGCEFIRVWPSLDAKTKNLAVARLKYVLGQKRWYWVNIYPWVWTHTRDFDVLAHIAPADLGSQKDLFYFLQANDLYQFRKAQLETIDLYMKKEEPEQYARKVREKENRIEETKKRAGGWYGRSDDGKNEYKDGKMYWTGTVSAAFQVPEGLAKVMIQTKGSQADGIYPYMAVELDGREIGATFVDNEDWKEYAFKINSGGGPKVLSITFCNDGADTEKNEDRNLYIGEARIVKDEQ